MTLENRALVRVAGLVSRGGAATVVVVVGARDVDVVAENMFPSI